MKKLEGYQKGINLGGWLSQCRDHYNEEHYSTFIVEKDIETIAGWGVDHVRVPIDYNVLETEDGQWIESGFAHVDDCVRWCKKYHLNMVFDIHKARGFVFDDVNYTSFFEDEALQDQFVALWEEIIRRYQNESDMMIFELLNEITEFRFVEPWNAIVAKTVTAIRKISKDVKIVIGGIFNSSIFGMTLLEKPADENIVFTVHCYSPLGFTHQKAAWLPQIPQDKQVTYPDTVTKYKEESQKIFGSDFDDEYQGLTDKMLNEKYFIHIFERAVARGEEWNVPVYCGEYGVIDQATPADTLNWYRDIHAAFEHYNMPRAAWSYKQMDFGLSDERLKEIQKDLIQLL